MGHRDETPDLPAIREALVGGFHARSIGISCCLWNCVYGAFSRTPPGLGGGLQVALALDQSLCSVWGSTNRSFVVIPRMWCGF